MSTLRISNIEAKSVPASATVDEKVKITNSSGDTLVFIDGKTSGITTVGINTTDGNIKFDQNSNVVVTGIITATKFSGQFEPTSLSLSGDLSIPDKIVHTGNTNTAIRFPTDDHISFETASTERFRITNSGEVKIMNTSGTVGLYFQSSSGAVSNLRAIGTNNQSLGYFFGNTEKIRFSSDGKFGVGTISPDSLVHIHNGSAGSVSAPATSNLTIESSGSANILQFLSPATAEQQVRFGDVSDTGAGYIAYNHSSNRLSIGVNGPSKFQIESNGKTLIGNDSNGNAPRTRLEVLETHDTSGAGTFTPVMRLSTTAYGTEQGPQLQFGTTNSSYPTWTYGDICAGYEGGAFGGALIFRTNSGSSATAVSERGRWTRDGDLRIGDGNLVIATNGHGIDFSANTDLGGRTDHEVLDDYEEGYWTPTVGGSGGDGSTVYSNQKGSYVKIGSLVYCSFYLGWNSTTASGTFYLRSIPYQQISTYGTNYNITTGSIMFDAVDVPYQYGQLTLYQPHAADFFMFYGSYHTSGWSAVSWNSNWTNGGTLIGSICYRAA